MSTIKSILKKIISWIVTAVLICSVLLCLILSIKIVTSGDKSLLGYSWFYIISGSMGDTLPVDSFVIVHKDADGEYDVGEIVTFISGNPEIKGYPNTHRIVDKRTEDGVTSYSTKGDANAVADSEWITSDVIIGKVVLKGGQSDWLGSLLAFLTTPGGFMTLILIPLTLITVPVIKDEVKKMKNLAAEAKKASDISKKK